MLQLWASQILMKMASYTLTRGSLPRRRLFFFFLSTRLFLLVQLPIKPFSLEVMALPTQLRSLEVSRKMKRLLLQMEFHRVQGIVRRALVAVRVVQMAMAVGEAQALLVLTMAAKSKVSWRSEAQQIRLLLHPRLHRPVMFVWRCWTRSECATMTHLLLIVGLL